MTQKQNKDLLMVVAGLDVQVLSLIARRDKARDYILNKSMQIEAELCNAQINTLTTHREVLMAMANTE